MKLVLNKVKITEQARELTKQKEIELEQYKELTRQRQIEFEMKKLEFEMMKYSKL